MTERANILTIGHLTIVLARTNHIHKWIQCYRMATKSIIMSITFPLTPLFFSEWSGQTCVFELSLHVDSLHNIMVRFDPIWQVSHFLYSQTLLIINWHLMKNFLSLSRRRRRSLTRSTLFGRFNTCLLDSIVYTASLAQFATDWMFNWPDLRT